MIAKKTLLLVIDNLAKGGAEVLLVEILPGLNDQYDVVLVTLSPECDFPEEKILCRKKYDLGFRNKYSLLNSAAKLKKIIKAEQPSLIHSHLFYSSLIARIACPDSIPILYSLHNEMSKNVFNESKILTLLEKKTIKNNHFAIAVSEIVKNDYKAIINDQMQIFVLSNYISNEFFETENLKKNLNVANQIKLIAVGNIKKQKNYSYLLKAFQHLENCPVTLDIYGTGNKKEIESLKAEIDKKKLPIFLKGKADDIPEILSKYDLFVSSSSYEGFGISVAEAMAAGLPLLLSDLPVFREVTFNNALFFDVSRPSSFVDLMIEIFENKYDLRILSNKGLEISKKYSKEIYLEKLFEVYESILKKHSLKSTLVNV